MIKHINFRIVNKKTIKNKIIFRSASIDLYDNGKLEKILKKYNISSWVDFRTQNEILYNKRLSMYNKIIHNFPIISGDSYKLPISPNAEDYLQYYIEILKNNSTVIRDIIVFLSDFNRNGNICVSCHAGKDRTGIISYIIQKLLNYDENTIKECYVMSGIYLYKYSNLFSNSARKKGLTLHEYSKRFLIIDNIFNLFNNYFHESFINFNIYLSIIGINKSTINKIKLLYGEEDDL